MLRLTTVRTSILGLIVLAAAGCQDPAPPATTDTPANGSPSTPTPVGADVDEHGCRPSAGYTWCARVARCVRPWELASEQGFENTREAFEAYCSANDGDHTEP